MNTKALGSQYRDCVTTNLEDAVEAWQALAEPLTNDWLLSAQGMYQSYSAENAHIVPAIKDELERAKRPKVDIDAMIGIPVSGTG